MPKIRHFIARLLTFFCSNECPDIIKDSKEACRRIKHFLKLPQNKLHQKTVAKWYNTFKCLDDVVPRFSSRGPRYNRKLAQYIQGLGLEVRDVKPSVLWISDVNPVVKK